MIIRYSKKFKKQYQKLPPKIREKTKERIKLWASNPYDASLRLHKLSGKMSRFYSINITGDIRALYEVVDAQVYFYHMIGSHSQLYE